MTKVKLCWVEELGCAHLVSAHIPYNTTQAVFGQVCIAQDFDNDGQFIGWNGRLYFSTLKKTVNDVLRPIGGGSFKRDTFKQAMRDIELETKRFLKSLGVEVEIEPPTFLNEMPYTMDLRKFLNSKD